MSSIEIDDKYDERRNRERPRLCSVHSVLSTTNIPIEVFLRINDHEFEKSVIAYYQSNEDTKTYLDQFHGTAIVDYVGCCASQTPCRSLGTLFSALRRFRPDIVHVHHATSAAISSFLARLFTNAKVVTTIHNNFKWFRPLQKLCIGWSILWSHMVVCNSENTLKSLSGVLPWLLRRKKVKVVYNGVNSVAISSELNAERPSLVRRDADEFIVVFIARLVPAKDVGTAIRGFAELLKKRPQAKLYIAGDGPLRSEMERLSSTLGGADRIQFLGMIPRGNVYALLKEADVFVVSSLFEGFCNAMVEAMFAGKAIVSSNIDVLQEVLGTECGRFFAVGDHARLADHLIELYDNADARVSLGERAKDRANARYRLDICEQAYVECYRDVLGLEK